MSGQKYDYDPKADRFRMVEPPKSWTVTVHTDDGGEFTVKGQRYEDWQEALRNPPSFARVLTEIPCGNPDTPPFYGLYETVFLNLDKVVCIHIVPEEPEPSPEPTV